MTERRRSGDAEPGRGAFSPSPHFRYNFIAFLVDYVFFGIAFTLINPSTVLPAFARTLTDLEPLIGLAATVFEAGWLLPQLGAAAMMAGRPRKKPYMMAAVCVGRPLFLVLALVTWAGLPRYPGAMLLTFLSCVGLFTLTDGVASVAWFDILARAVPLERRGRLLGAGQLLTGLLGIGVGALVVLVLGSPRLAYPKNYALIFALAVAAFIPSAVALSLLREPTASTNETRPSVRTFWKQLGSVWRGDRDFRLLVSSRWLVGLMSLSLPFYILHATEVIGLPQATAGWFVSAQMAGKITTSSALGWLTDRKGPRPVTWLAGAVALLCPLLALAIHSARGTPLAQFYPLVFFLYGVLTNCWLLGPLNYVLELAPEERRPLYVGLYNTLAGLLVPASFLGGVLLRATSYPILFGVTAAGVAAGLWVSLRLNEPGQRAEA
jgi:MFS family permease